MSKSTSTTRRPAQRQLNAKERFLLTASPLQLAYAILAHSGIKDLLADLTAPRRGRPIEGITAYDALAGLLACALTGRPVHFRTAAQILHEQMPANMDARRSMSRGWPGPTVTGSARRAQKRAAEEAVARRIRALAAALTQYTGPTGAGVTLGDVIDHTLDDLLGHPDADQRRSERLDRLRDLTNAIIGGSLDLMPDTLLARIPSTLAVDGTYVSGWSKPPKGHDSEQKVRSVTREVIETARPDIHRDALRDEVLRRLTNSAKRGKGSATRSAEQNIATCPEAGHYIRTTADGQSEYKGFGYEAHLVVTYEQGDRVASTSVPTLILAFTVDAPSVRPGENAIAGITRAIDWVNGHGRQVDLGVFDALYPQLSTQTFHEPLRRLGIMPIFRLREDQMGRQGVTYEGLDLIEGVWYCAQMPDHLVDASKNFAAGLIDRHEYDRLIEARTLWQAQRISGDAVLDEHGEPIDHRYECPSARRTCPIGCLRRPKSLVPGADQVKITPLEPGEVPPKACAQRTVRIPYAIGMGAEQAHPLLSAEWLKVNNLYRSTNESKNGALKAAGQQMVASNGTRRVTGLAMNTLLLACSLAAANALAVRAFLQESEIGEDGQLVRRYSTHRTAKKASRGSRGSGPVPATRVHTQDGHGADRRPSARALGRV